MRKVLRWMVAAVLAVFVVTAAVWTVWWWTGKRAYERCIRELRAEGRPVELADFAVPPIPENLNAAKKLEEAAQWLEKYKNDAEFSPLISYEFDDDVDKWEDADWERLYSYLENMQPYFDLLEQIPSRPGWWTDYGFSRGPPLTVWFLPALFEAGTHLEHLVRFDREEANRTERSARAAMLALDIADRFDPQTMIDYGLQQAVRRRACEIALIACKHGGFDAALFRDRLDPRVADAVPRSGPPRRILEAERAYALWFLFRVIEGDTDRIEELGVTIDGARRYWFGRPRVYRDAVWFSNLIDRAISLCDATPEEAARLSREFTHPGEGPPLLSDQGLVRIGFEMYAESVAALRLLRVVMALLEYKQETGAVPESLRALDSRFPDGMPTDPFGGGAFSYERTSQGVRVHANAPDDEWAVLLDKSLAWELE